MQILALTPIFCFVSLWPWPLEYGPENSQGDCARYCLYTSQVSKKFVENNRKKFGWHITEIADCAFSSSVILWPWPLTFAPINVYSCSTSYYLSTGQIWERSDEQEAQRATYRAPEYNVPPLKGFDHCRTRPALFVYWSAKNRQTW